MRVLNTPRPNQPFVSSSQDHQLRCVLAYPESHSGHKGPCPRMVRAAPRASSPPRCSLEALPTPLTDHVMDHEGWVAGLPCLLGEAVLDICRGRAVEVAVVDREVETMILGALEAANHLLVLDPCLAALCGPSEVPQARDTVGGPNLHLLDPGGGLAIDRACDLGRSRLHHGLRDPKIHDCNLFCTYPSRRSRSGRTFCRRGGFRCRVK